MRRQEAVGEIYVFPLHISPRSRYIEGCHGVVLSACFHVRLQVVQAGFKVLADHLVEVDQGTHQLAHEGLGAVHGPGDVGASSSGFEVELGDVAGLEGFDEVELDDKL